MPSSSTPQTTSPIASIMPAPNDPEGLEELTPAQLRAISNIRAQAMALRDDAVNTLSHIQFMANIKPSALDAARAAIRDHAHIAIHFHPDRPLADGTTVSQALLRDGVYRNQFETGISNGLVSVAPGGPRDVWERSLFSGAYHHNDNPPAAAERPKYGALDLTCAADGPAPRFGSCYLVLKSSVSRRSTLTFGGSQADPKVRGTVDEFDAILAALMEESFTRDFMLGVSDIRPAAVVDSLFKSPSTPRRFRKGLSRNLDHMIEAQVHGDIRLDRDVEALVADGSFSTGPMSDVLREISQKFAFPVQFNRGFRLPFDGVPSDFRGPRMPSLAARLGTAHVDARAIGAAAQDLFRHRDRWSDRGTYEEVLQELKLLWHAVVRYG